MEIGKEHDPIEVPLPRAPGKEEPAGPLTEPVPEAEPAPEKVPA